MGRKTIQPLILNAHVMPDMEVILQAMNWALHENVSLHTNGLDVTFPRPGHLLQSLAARN